MRTALVLPQMAAQRGGAEAWLAGFMPLLVREGHEVHVVSFEPATHDLPVQVHRIEPRGWTRARRIWSFACQVADLLGREEFDVVHDLGYGYECNVLQPHGGTRGRSYDQNLLCVHGLERVVRSWTYALDPSHRVYARIARRQYQPDADRLFVAISQMVARDMQHYYGVPEAKIRLVYNGVDTERFHPRHREAHRQDVRTAWGAGERVVFLMAAHNLRLKGMADLVQATARLKARRAEEFLVVIVGRGDPTRYRRAAQRLACDDHIHYAGPVQDMVPCYAGADVYVQPTYYDPCSLVVLEALASGLPVITTRFNGAGELFEHEQEGFLVDAPWCHEALVAAMDACLDADRREAMGVRARAAAGQHDLARNYQEMLAVYEEAALL